MSKRVTDSEKAFNQGVAFVLAFLIRDHGMPTLALDAMVNGGISLQDLERSGVDAYDLAPIKRAFA